MDEILNINVNTKKKIEQILKKIEKKNQNLQNLSYKLLWKTGKYRLLIRTNS